MTAAAAAKAVTALVVFGQHCRQFQNCRRAHTIQQGEGDQRAVGVSRLNFEGWVLLQQEVTQFER